MAAPRSAMTYAAAGVDTEAQRKAVDALAARLSFRRTGDGAPLTGLSHFAGLVALGSKALALCTDGVGTKIEIANRLRKWDTIGIDVIAVNVNDCICVGAEPLAFVDYIAIQKADPEITAQIGKGLDVGAKMANVTLSGGETAILPEVVNGLDLSGACVGVVDRKKIVDGKKVRPGDALIGLASSGLHSNGYTLARRILQAQDIGLSEACPGMVGKNWGRVLLEPTRIYVRPILKLLARHDVHALANVSGSGLMNLPRMAPRLRFRVTEPFEPPAVFQNLAEMGPVQEREMFRTFNMGLGFVACVAQGEADAAVRFLKRQGEEARVIGRVEKGHGALHEPTGLEFESKTGARA